MLQFIRRLLAPPPKAASLSGRQIAFWSKEELTDLSPRLASVFGLQSLDRDYENAWEWLEGTAVDGLHVNISRTHDWKTGDHHLPVVVSLRRSGAFIPEEEVERWARALVENLDTDIAVGSVTEEESSSAEYGFRRDHDFPKPKRG
jgi:hypothetical protein